MTNLVPLPMKSAPDRPQPVNLEAEQALLGGLMVANPAIDRVAAIIGPEDFFLLVHQRIYGAILDAAAAGRPATPVTLKTEMDGDEALKEQGGAVYLARLAGAAVTVINIEEYAKLISALSVRRRLIRVADEIAAQAYDAPLAVTAQAQIEAAEAALDGVQTVARDTTGRAMGIGAAARLAVDQAEEARTSTGVVGVTTGIDDLDQLMGGHRPSKLIVVAGRPSMGKSALAIDMATAAARSGRQVAYYSLEMDAEEIAQRVLAAETRIPYQAIADGRLSIDQVIELDKSREALDALPLIIRDAGVSTTAGLRTDLRRLWRRGPVGLIVVDYLQLLRGTSATRNNKVAEVTEISNDLKAIARDFKVPVVALSQLSRQVESRDDKRPMLSDLRESGAIEQDADIVLFVYREEYYLRRAEPPAGTAEHAAWEVKLDACRNTLDAIMAKARGRRIGSVRLFADLATNRFGNLEGGYRG